MDLENKVVLITGGAGGLGSAITKELLRGGVKHVALLDLETSDGEESANELNSEFGKGRAIFIACDVTKVSDLEAAFAKTVKEFGGLDIVVNNAGLLNERQWELMTDVNFNGVVRGMYLGLEYMGKHKGGNGGVIVNMASIAGLDRIPWAPVYVATKHAIIGLSGSFGAPHYYEKTGVRVVALCPGFTHTQLVANLPNVMPDIVDVNVALADLSSYPTQQPESVAQSVTQVIKSAKSGSYWVCEGGESVHQVFIPGRSAIKTAPK